jgi:hypothetical protein
MGVPVDAGLRHQLSLPAFLGVFFAADGWSHLEFGVRCRFFEVLQIGEGRMAPWRRVVQSNPKTQPVDQ